MAKKEPTSPQILNGIVDGLNQAIGACSQLAHVVQHPGFLTLREGLELAKDGVIHVATFQAVRTGVRTGVRKA